MFGLYTAVFRKNQYCYVLCTRHIQISSHLRKAIPKKCICGEEEVKKQKSWLLRKINLLFGKYLFLTNTLGSGILMSVGDIVQQHIEYVTDGLHKDGYDWKRNLNMGLVGTAMGPVAHYFYQFLDFKLPGHKLNTVIKKICIDQTVASPIFILSFFLGMSYLNNATLEEAKNELKEKFFVVYAADCSVWIPSQFINFYWLSPEYRVTYINLITVCYNIFLSFIKHNDISF